MISLLNEETTTEKAGLERFNKPVHIFNPAERHIGERPDAREDGERSAQSAERRLQLIRQQTALRTGDIRLQVVWAVV